MSKSTPILAFAGILSLALTPILPALTGGPDGGVKVGDSLKSLADRKVMTTTGKEFSFRQLLPSEENNEKKEGSVFVLSFWSSTCPWSVAWDTELAAIAKDYESKGVKVFGIDANKHEIGSEQGITAVNGYIAKKELPFPVLVDEQNKIADFFDAKTTPHIYLCDRKGNVIYTGAIDDDAHQQKEAAERKTYLRDALDQYLAGQEVAVKETKPKGCGIKRLSKAELEKMTPGKLQS